MNTPSVGIVLFVVMVVPAFASAVALNPVQATIVATSSPERAIAPAPQEASTDYLLKIDGVEGESGAAPALLEIDTIRGESPETKKGNVEYGWKVEEGESSRPAELDISAGGEQPLTPDLAVLLGGSDVSEAVRKEVASILLQGAQEAGAPVENISINYEKITVRTRQSVKLLGLIPVSTWAQVEVSGDSSVYTKYPWWAMFASGKDANGVAATVVSTLSNVLKTKHDTIKNSISNTR